MRASPTPRALIFTDTSRRFWFQTDPHSEVPGMGMWADPIQPSAVAISFVALSTF